MAAGRSPVAGRSVLRPSPRRSAALHGVTGRWSIQSEEAARGNDGVEIAVAADDGRQFPFVDQRGPDGDARDDVLPFRFPAFAV